MSKKFKTTVMLATIMELSHAEIAQIEGCSTGTVKSRLFRGKQILRKQLAPLLSPKSLGASNEKNM
ncbi:MAG: hypothetical protein JXR91_08415 [Deltaproteobacteria bacterium]|nr:hypothetical protein [Deltaproteobacteria bacterium]